MMTREEWVRLWMAMCSPLPKTPSLVSVANRLLDHDAEQRAEMARLREALHDKEDDIRHLIASVMQLVALCRCALPLNGYRKGIVDKAEHLLKVIGEKQALKESQ